MNITDNVRKYSFTKRTLAAVALLAALVIFVFVLKKVDHVLLSVFAGVLLAVFFDGVATWITKRLPVPHGLSLTFVILAFAGILFSVAWFGGPGIVDQAGKLTERLSAGLADIRQELDKFDWGKQIVQHVTELKDVGSLGSAILGQVEQVVSGVFGAIGTIFMVFFIGAYVSVQPGLYIESIVHLIPISRRKRGREVIAGVGNALRWWLVGRVSSMVVVGILTSAGLWAIGAPLPVTLGVIAALFSFVPILGPAAAMIPAILVGLAESFGLAIWVVVIFLGVQGLESYLITPLIQQKAVSIPPALLLSVQIIFGTLFGIMGMLLATPIAVTAIVVIQMLYINDALEDHVSPMGEH
ncbi:MAG: AI-2E family transporter [Anaerolineales bacterium]|jgi:predicted PurR-regulated permease PerM